VGERENRLLSGGREAGLQPAGRASRLLAFSFRSQAVRLVKPSITIRIRERMIWTWFLAGLLTGE